MAKFFITTLLVLLTCACTSKENPLSNLPDMSAVRANLAFTCAIEADHLPALDLEADQLFKYARYLEKQEGPKDFNNMARYYRIAAAHGHYKANNNLQLLVSHGNADSPDGPKEVIALASQLIDQGVPAGYYNIGHYLELGYGLKQDEEMSLRFFRKAADLGSPEAQYYVGDLLGPKEKSPIIAREMLQCATNQGYREAANMLGIGLQTSKLFPEAVQAFQKGVAAGDTMSTSFLEDGFKAPPSTELLNYMALANDPERSRRYRLILEFLRYNDGRNPKVSDIDKIVPLPPAKLPAWDGTFQWQKDQDAAVPPAKPSEELIERMSKAKNLDPTTGLPIAPPKNDPNKIALGTQTMTGELCPQSGVWCAQLFADQRAGQTRYAFNTGTKMPLLWVSETRGLGVLDFFAGRRSSEEAVIWELVAYHNSQA